MGTQCTEVGSLGDSSTWGFEGSPQQKAKQHFTKKGSDEKTLTKISRPEISDAKLFCLVNLAQPWSSAELVSDQYISSPGTVGP